jgi:hypothetical protein
MLWMMADENGELWGTDFLVDMETVEAVIKAYTKGDIKLERPSNMGPPEFRRARAEYAYTAVTVGKFLGWMKPGGDPQERVKIALRALELIEEGILKPEQFEELGNKAALALVQEAETAKKRGQSTKEVSQRLLESAEKSSKDAEAWVSKAKTKEEKEAAIKELNEAEFREKQVKAEINHAKKYATETGDKVSEALKTGTGYRHVREITDKVTSGWKGPKTVVPSEVFVSKISTEILEFIHSDFDKKRVERIQAVIDSKDELDADQIETFVENLNDLSERCLDFAAKLQIKSKMKHAGSRRTLPALPEN